MPYTGKQPSSQLPADYRQVFSRLKHALATIQANGWAPSDQTTQEDGPVATVDTITQFGHLYLKASAIFAWVRHQPQWHGFMAPMQRVLVEANVLLYPEPGFSWSALGRFVAFEVPARFWRDRYFHLAAAVICATSAFVAFWLVLGNFELAAVFMPGAIRDLKELDAYFFSPQARHEMLTYGRDAGLKVKTVFAVFLMQHNISVAVQCFLSGFVFGVPTVLMLVETGMMLGSLPALFFPTDVVALGAWLLPHGVPEVGAILLAGGGGLRIAYTMLNPGSVAEVAQDAGHLKPGAAIGLGTALQTVMRQLSGTVVVVAAMLVWAGFVESFVRQSTASDSVRYFLAIVSVVPIVALFTWGAVADDRLKRQQCERLT